MSFNSLKMNDPDECQNNTVFRVDIFISGITFSEQETRAEVTIFSNIFYIYTMVEHKFGCNNDG